MLKWVFAIVVAVAAAAVVAWGFQQAASAFAGAVATAQQVAR